MSFDIKKNNDNKSLVYSIKDNTHISSTGEERFDSEVGKNILKDVLKLVPNLVETIKSSNQSSDILYKLIIPKNKDLLNEGGGILKGVLYGKNLKGKNVIKEHLSFKKASPTSAIDVKNVLKGVGSQIILVHISQQLSQIDEKLDRILEKFEKYNEAEVKALIKEFDRTEERNALTQDTINSHSRDIRKVLDKLKTDIKDNIKEIPSKNGFWDNWFGSNTDKATEHTKKVIDKLTLYYRGLLSLNKAYKYSDYSGNNIAEKQIREDFELINSVTNDSNFLESLRMSQKIKINGVEQFPEEFFKKLDDQTKKAKNYLDNFQSKSLDRVENIEIEFTQKQFKELSNE